MDIDLRYPIGKYVAKDQITQEELRSFIDRVSTLPDRLAAAIKGMTSSQVDTPYREGGWTVRQVVHHVADSHMNAFIRVKWSLTESTPTIKAYDEKGWATTPETTEDPAISLALLKTLHVKWVAIANKLTPDMWAKDFIHPATGKKARLDQMTGMYAWHGDHHLAHITSLKERMKW